MCIRDRDYSNGTGDRNIITRFNLAPEVIQFLLTRITSGFQEFEWSQSKIYGNPDQNGYSTAQMLSLIHISVSVWYHAPLQFPGDQAH